MFSVKFHGSVIGGLSFPVIQMIHKHVRISYDAKLKSSKVSDIQEQNFTFILWINDLNQVVHLHM